jgi:hypothetical protein
MAVITQTNGVKGFGSNGAVNITRTTLGASDTLTYVPGANQTLILYNTTASIVAITAVGSAPTPIVIPGGTVSTSSGKVISVPANGLTHVDLDDLAPYFDGTGTVTLTGGTGVTAGLYI